MAKEEDKNKVQISCPNCDVSYWVKVWEDEDYEKTTTCPFCQADTTIDDDDAIFEHDEEEDDWN